MAEERIVLTIDDGYCATKCEYFPIACSAECEHIDKPTFSYTRQEAIKKIETHLKASTIKFSTTPDVVAEIALNALLGDKE